MVGLGFFTDTSPAQPQPFRLRLSNSLGMLASPRCSTALALWKEASFEPLQTCSDLNRLLSGLPSCDLTRTFFVLVRNFPLFSGCGLLFLFTLPPCFGGELSPATSDKHRKGGQFWGPCVSKMFLVFLRSFVCQKLPRSPSLYSCPLGGERA